jgi:DNA-binding LytR/AlgR family response regulator
MDELISILIVEDESIWIQTLSLILKELGFSVVKAVSTVDEALTAFKDCKYDVILLDINLNGKNSGIELGNVINKLYHKPFIFVTSSDDYDLMEMADVKPSAYLRKPVNSASLFIAIQNAINNFSNGNGASDGNMLQSFFVKQGNRYKKINWTDVAYITAGKNYVSVFNTIDKTDYYIRSSLQRVLQNIIPRQLQKNYVQVNRSEIVQMAFIQELSNDKVVTPYKNFIVTDLFSRELKNRLNIV